WWKARCWKSGRHDRAPTEAWSRCAARRAINAARSCKCSRRKSSCRVIPRLRTTELVDRQRVWRAAEILVQRGAEHRRAGLRGREQRHGRAELQVVRAPEDLMGRTVFDLVNQTGALDQPRPQHRMSQVSLGLGERAYRVVTSHGAVPEAGQLRKHEPQPMAGFAAIAEFAENLAHDRGLG